MLRLHVFRPTTTGYYLLTARSSSAPCWPSSWKKTAGRFLVSAVITSIAAQASAAAANVAAPPAPQAVILAPLAGAASSTIEDILAGGSSEPDYEALERRIDASESDGIERELVADIREVEVATDRYNAALIEPLRLLGKLYHNTERYPEAVDVLARATQISRLETGLHSASQLQLVYAEIESLIAMERLLEANARHEYAFSVARRSHGNFSTEIVPVLLKLANWYAQTGNLFAARGHFLHARNLLSARRSTTHSDEMISALRGLANSFREERFPTYVAGTSEEAVELAEKNAIYANQSPNDIQTLQLSVNAFHRGTEALKAIVAIEERRLIVVALTRQEQAEAERAASAQPASDQTATPIVDSSADGNANATAEQTTEPTADPTANPDVIVLNKTDIDPSQVVVSETLDPLVRDPSTDKSAFLHSVVELADWYLLMEKSKQAFAYYRHAYRIAAADPRTDVEALFGEPVLLYSSRPRPPLIPASVSPSAREIGFVELSYNIDANGTVRRMKTLNSEPKGLMVFQVRRAIGDARYRPRIVSGFPQATSNVNFRHDFEYVPKTATPTQKLSQNHGE